MSEEIIKVLDELGKRLRNCNRLEQSKYNSIFARIITKVHML